MVGQTDPKILRLVLHKKYSFPLHSILNIMQDLTILYAATHTDLSIVAFVTRAGKVLNKLTNLRSSRQFAPELEAVC